MSDLVAACGGVGCTRGSCLVPRELHALETLNPGPMEGGSTGTGGGHGGAAEGGGDPVPWGGGGSRGREEQGASPPCPVSLPGLPAAVLCRVELLRRLRLLGCLALLLLGLLLLGEPGGPAGGRASEPGRRSPGRRTPLRLHPWGRAGRNDGRVQERRLSCACRGGREGGREAPVRKASQQPQAGCRIHHFLGFEQPRQQPEALQETKLEARGCSADRRGEGSPEGQPSERPSEGFGFIGQP